MGTDFGYLYIWDQFWTQSAQAEADVVGVEAESAGEGLEEDDGEDGEGQKEDEPEQESPNTGCLGPEPSPGAPGLWTKGCCVFLDIGDGHEATPRGGGIWHLQER